MWNGYNTCVAGSIRCCGGIDFDGVVRLILPNWRCVHTAWAARDTVQEPPLTIGDRYCWYVLQQAIMATALWTFFDCSLRRNGVVIATSVVSTPGICSIPTESLSRVQLPQNINNCHVTDTRTLCYSSVLSEFQVALSATSQFLSRQEPLRSIQCCKSSFKIYLGKSRSSHWKFYLSSSRNYIYLSKK